MINKQSKTALLLFTHTAEDEIKQKRFKNNVGLKGNKLIAEALIYKAAQTLNKTGLPLFIISTDKQIGNSFGERFANAIRQVLEKGFDKVIAVGNDCPELIGQDIKNAASALEANNIVIGPTSKGGAYLIGIRRSNFNEKHFKTLRWNSSLVLDDLLFYASERRSEVIRLTEKNDINNENDIKDFLQFTPLNSFLIKIRSIIFSFTKNLSTIIYCFFVCLLHSSIGLRAPPTLAN